MTLGIISTVFEADGCSEEDLGGTAGDLGLRLGSGLLDPSGLQTAGLNPGLWVVAEPLRGQPGLSLFCRPRYHPEAAWHLLRGKWFSPTCRVGLQHL